MVTETAATTTRTLTCTPTTTSASPTGDKSSIASSQSPN